MKRRLANLVEGDPKAQFKPQTVCLQRDKRLFNLVLNISLSWQFCRLVLRGIQISSWITSTVLLLKNVSRNLLSLSKLWSATSFLSRGKKPTLSFSTIAEKQLAISRLNYKFYFVSLERMSPTKNISRFSTQLNDSALAEWSKHCLANCPQYAF